MKTVDASSLFDVNISVSEGGYFSPKPSVDWSTKTHRAGMSKFYYITDGSCEIVINDKKYTARAGDWFFIPARTLHSYRNFRGKPFSKYWMHFDLSPERDITGLLGIGYRLRLSDRERSDELFSEFAKIFPGSDFADRLAVKAIALELLSLFIKASDKKRSEIRVGEGSVLSEVISYIESNMSRPVRNENLAAIAHMHPTHFIRFFKGETGQTPREYINRRKMEIAKTMLESTELQIGEISERLGFFDSMHFSKTFKKRYSISPTAYRESYLDS